MSSAKKSCFRKHFVTIVLHGTDTWAPIITQQYNDGIFSAFIQARWIKGTNRVFAYALGFNRISTPPAINIYIEFENVIDSAEVKLQWGDRKYETRQGSACDINKILKLVGVIENVRPGGPLGPLVERAHSEKIEAIARVPLTVMCTDCGRAHAGVCGNKWCTSTLGGCNDVPGCLPKNMLACLSCSTPFCSRKCAENHFCGLDAVNPDMPLLTVVVTKVSKQPFTLPPNVRDDFRDYQFGVALEEVRTHVHIRPFELNAMAARILERVGQYATFVLTEEGTPGLKFALALRGTYKKVEVLPDTEQLSRELDISYNQTQRQNETLQQFMFTNKMKEDRSDLNGETGMQNGSIPLSREDCFKLFDCIAEHADDDAENPALCIKMTAFLTNGLAGLLQRQFKMAPSIPEWGKTARERVGLVFMHMFMRPEHRKYQRIHEIACHLLNLYGRA